MEYDFSDQAKEFLESQSAKRRGPKSSAQTPAKPSERKKGSKKNPKGSAGGGKKAPPITFSEKVITSLKNKVKEHNAKHSKKVTLGQLKNWPSKMKFSNFLIMCFKFKDYIVSSIFFCNKHHLYMI